jgi:hypothetical protein
VDTLFFGQRRKAVAMYHLLGLSVEQNSLALPIQAPAPPHGTDTGITKNNYEKDKTRMMSAEMAALRMVTKHLLIRLD